MSDAVAYRRDAVTWTGFALLGVWALFLYFLGPAASAIGDDLGLSTAATGAIGTALAVGTTGSALLGPALVRRRGRRATLLLVLPGLTAAALLLALGVAYPLVLVGVLGIGLLGATTANLSTAILSDHHRAGAARAITEANATASWLGVISPALLGFALALPPGWRGAGLVLAVLPLLVLLRARGLPKDQAPVADSAVAAGSHPLPRVFWLSLVVVACAVSMEFSITFWAAPLIVERTGSPAAAAATALSALTLGMALARTSAAPLTSRYPLPRLILACFAIASAGLLGLLLVGSFVGCVAALFVTGLGLSLLFPCAQSWSLQLAGQGPDRAVGMTAVASGVALGAGPLLLGVLAGAVGLTGAMSAGFVIAAAGVAMTLALWAMRRAG